jgi:ABC-type Fe3+-siderophore transport system permease subunit
MNRAGAFPMASGLPAFDPLPTLRLDAGGFGDETLTSIGLSPSALRGGLVVVSVLLCAGSVAAVGSMSFLGLLAPMLRASWWAARTISCRQAP